MYLFWFSISLLICLLEQCSADSEVKFAVVMFRHGDRTPLSTFPTDPWKNYSAWSIGLGQLNNMGKLRLFNLGQSIRRRYKHLLSDDFKSDEIYVRSTDVDRTIMSALAYLAGKYPVKKENEFLPGLAWQPTPIHIVPMEQDAILGKKHFCARYEYELYKIFSTPEYRQKIRELGPLFEYLTRWTGAEVSSIQDVAKISDVLNVEDKSYNLSLPTWTKPVYPNIIRKAGLIYFNAMTYNSILKQLSVGPVMKEINGYLRAAASGEPVYKVVVFSVHDMNLVNLLDSLGVFPPHYPEFGAVLLIELLQGADGEEDFVRLTYQNEVLHIPGCGKLCAFSRWVHLYKWLMQGDHKRECELNSRRLTKYQMFKLQFTSPGGRNIDPNLENDVRFMRIFP